MAPEPEPPLDMELEAIEVGAALLEDMVSLADEAGAELEEAAELSWATAPLAAKAARRATGMMLNFILTVATAGTKKGDERCERSEGKMEDWGW